MNKFNQGDSAFYGHKEYVIVGFDEINESVQLEGVEDGEELVADETLLLTKEEYESLQESDYEDIEEDTDEEEVDESEEEIEEELTDEFEDDEEIEEELDEEEADEDLDEETKAAATLKMHPSAATDSAKSMMISNTISAMSNMNKGDMVDFYNKMMSQYGKGKDFGVPAGAASKNKSSVEMKKVAKEDLSEILDGMELSEDVKEKISTLFESAVHLRVVEQVKEIQEAFDEQLEEAVEAHVEELEEHVDSYLSYVAEEWMKENEVAIYSNLKTEFAENFMVGLKNLFVEHYIDVPEEQVDVVEALAEKVEELEEELNEQVLTNIEMTEALEQYAAEDIFGEVAEGLAMTQVEKLRTLSEGIEFGGDVDEYRSKLETIKQAHFKLKTPESRLNEEVDIEEDKEDKVIDPTVNRYVQAISRTIKR